MPDNDNKEEEVQTQVVQHESRRTSMDIIMDDEVYNKMYRMSCMLAEAQCTVPEHLAGNKGDCFAVVLQAAQWSMNPFMVAQKTHLIHGKLGYEAQLVNAVIHSNGPLVGRLQHKHHGPWENLVGKYQMTGEGKKKYAQARYTFADEQNCGITISGLLKGETEPSQLTLYMQEVSNRNSTLWANMPKQQIFYLASKMWARMYCPDVILGVYTPDEIQAIPVEASQVTTVEDEPVVMATGQEIAYIQTLANQPALKDQAKVKRAMSRMEGQDVTQKAARITTRILTAALKKAKADIPPMPDDDEPATKEAELIETKAKPIEQDIPEPDEKPKEEPKPQANAFDRTRAMKRFHAKGNEILGGEWENERKEIMYSMFQKTSSADLTDEELVKATEELHRIEARQSNQQD